MRSPHTPCPNGTPRSRGPEAGFTMVEVIIAILILAIGILGLAGTTALSVRQVNMSNVATERSVALQTTVERIRAMEFDSVSTGTHSVGGYDVSWKALPAGSTKLVQIVWTGPGLKSVAGGLPILASEVADTFTYRLIRP